MGHLDTRPPVDWRTMTREEKLAWARMVVEETPVLYEVEDD